jgi:hypothetical protein
MGDAIDRSDVDEYVRSMQQDYGASRALNLEAAQKARAERDLVAQNVRKILESIAPLLPGEVRYEAHVVDSVPVALTRAVSDGTQLILIGRHYIAFLRSMIPAMMSGVNLNVDGGISVQYGVSDEEATAFGVLLGEYLEIGTPLTLPARHGDELSHYILLAAVEFILAHEIVHQIEAHSDVPDLSLTGFQDFCRLRGREFLCDKRAVGLLLLRRAKADTPELAFAGAVMALLAIGWLEQFTPGSQPGGGDKLFHPGTDTRLLRVHLEEPLSWRAAGLGGEPNGVTGAILRRAFRFISAFERDPKLLATPMNRLTSAVLASDPVDAVRFKSLVGEWLARGRVDQVARLLGAFWGSAEVMAVEEQNDPTLTDLTGTRSVPLFEEIYAQLANSNAGARAAAEEMAGARAHRRQHPEAF